jgi:hypothetical protein
MDNEVSKKELLKEMAFCLELWEKQSGCTFGGCTQCAACAVPYLLLKLLTGEMLHGNMQRLTLREWREKYDQLNSKYLD